MMNKRLGYHLLLLVAMPSLLIACASSTYQKVGPTSILQAEEEIPHLSHVQNNSYSF